MTLESSKNLGGIGAILMFISVIPYVPYLGILSLVGLILVLVALYGLANYYRESGIFNNALYAVVAVIVGGIVFAAVAFIVLIDFFAALGVTLGIGNLPELATVLTQIDWINVGFGIIGNFLAYILLDLVLLFAFVIITAILLRRSLGLLSAKSGVGMFGTTGTLILVGAILTIIAIGLLLVWIALLLLAVAFFSIKPQQAPPPPPTQV
jgi:uncharacterized membrane protein